MQLIKFPRDCSSRNDECAADRLGVMNVCQACGACCATLRVTFPADEADIHPGGSVPAGFAERYGNVFCMKTTADGRCLALRGEVGRGVSCRIYSQRPSSCRDFGPMAALGRGDQACNDARRRCGLPLLEVMDDDGGRS